MPPAFNLSQDQTLQLILLAPALLPEPITSCFTQSKRGLLLYEHLIPEALASPQRKKLRLGAGAFISSAHTYRLRIFKERLLRTSLLQTSLAEADGVRCSGRRRSK
jgi:hypothetical protein